MPIWKEDMVKLLCRGAFEGGSRDARPTRGRSQEGKREREYMDLSARTQKRKRRNYSVPGGGTIPNERHRVDSGNISNVDSAVERRVPEHDHHVISSGSYLLSSLCFIYV
jgi:hypothetical protein